MTKPCPEIAILHRRTNAVLFSGPFESLRDAVEAAIKTRANLSGADLSEADLSGAKLSCAKLSGADLSGAKLSCAKLSGANLSGADLSYAKLSCADLSGAKLSCAKLSCAKLSCAKLSEADLSGAKLSGANLSEANLSGADLSGADLSGVKLSFDIPSVPAIDAAILSAIDAGGELEMSTWHRCGTAHCRGGWAVVKAGEAGMELEKRLGTNAAAALIYAASRPGVRVPDFFAFHDVAMADIRAHAAQQVAQ